MGAVDRGGMGLRFGCSSCFLDCQDLSDGRVRSRSRWNPTTVFPWPGLLEVKELRGWGHRTQYFSKGTVLVRGQAMLLSHCCYHKTEMYFSLTEQSGEVVQPSCPGSFYFVA